MLATMDLEPVVSLRVGEQNEVVQDSSDRQSPLSATQLRHVPVMHGSFSDSLAVCTRALPSRLVSCHDFAALSTSIFPTAARFHSAFSSQTRSRPSPISFSGRPSLRHSKLLPQISLKSVAVVPSVVPPPTPSFPPPRPFAPGSAFLARPSQ